MFNVIEIDAADREVAKLIESGRPWDAGERRALGLEGERNKAGETSRFILELPQLSQVVDPVFVRLDVPVEHRASAAATHPVPGSMHVKPFRSAFLAPAQFIAHSRIENLGAAPSERTETGLAQD